MQAHYYSNLSEAEKKHWYFAARRQLIKDLISRHILTPKKEARLKILDVGCGTVGTTDFLTRFGSVTAIEPSEVAIKLLKTNYPYLNVVKASIENMAPLLTDANFDLATVLGVLYHKEVKSPQGALKSINRKLKVGGWLIWHEAAYPFLKRKHDALSHGARRFLPSQMRSLLCASGFRIYFETHVGLFIFPLAFVLALLSKMKPLAAGKESPLEASSVDRKLLPKYLNAILYLVSRLEMKYAVNISPIPIGVSYLVMAKKINA